MMSSCRQLLAALALSATAVTANAAFPDRELAGVIMWGAGGATDVVARGLAPHADAALGKKIVLTNRPGGTGAISTNFVLNAPADGYTLLYATSTTMASNLALQSNLRYDPLRDFAPVHGLFQSPLVLVVEASRPYRSVADLVKDAKARPGALSFASAGSGTAPHLVGELFQSTTGVKLLHVPYKGTAPAFQDLLGGRLDVMFDYPSIMLPHIKAGKVRALAVMSSQRLQAMPELPTIAESGYPDAALSAWSSVVAPAGTPPEVLNKLTAAVAHALRDPAVVGPSQGLGSVPFAGMGQQELRRFIESEQKVWGDVVRRSGATANN